MPSVACLVASAAALTSVLVAFLGRALSTKPYARQPLRLHAWGPLPDISEPDDVREFTVPDWTLEEDFAKRRLSDGAGAPHPVPRFGSPGVTYGVDHDELAVLAGEWAGNWSWRTSAAADALRALPNFVWRVAGLDLHFIHIVADPTTAADCPSDPLLVRRLPLLLLHGWPGSVLEFTGILPLLTERCGPDGTLFDVVAPSLPGFGFSSVPAVRGLGAVATAELLVRLMGRLGYSAKPAGWWVQGGDWGGVVATSIAQVVGAAAPKDRPHLRLPLVPAPLPLRGVHLNFVPAVPLWSALVYAASAALPPALQWLVWGPGEAGAREYERSGLPLPRFASHLLEITGYMHLQATRPDTLAVALHDSPLATAAWLLEKFAAWSDLSSHNGSAIAHFSADWLIASIALYHYSGTAASSLRYYRETLADPAFGAALITSVPAEIPFAVADLPHEMNRVPRWFARSKLPGLTAYDTFPRGGHFAAAEEPALLAAHVHATLGKIDAGTPRGRAA